MSEKERMMIHPTVKVHESAFVDLPCTIKEGSSVWHYTHVREECHIGRYCNIGQNCYVGRGVKLGDFCKVQNNVSLYEDVILEDEVFCGPSSVFTNVINPRAAIERKNEFRPTLVKRGATIGANATIICGYTIGRWAMIGAGCLVRENVPDFALMVGVPARHIGWVNIRGVTLPPMAVGEKWTCPEDGSVYHLERIDRLKLISPEPPLKTL